MLSPAGISDRSARADERLLALPALVVLAILFAVPLFVLFSFSFDGPTPMAAYERFFASAAAMKILRNTVIMAASVTGICALVSVPFALALPKLSPTYARIALLATTLPMWISILVRSYAWLYVLSTEGVINSVLLGIGLVDTPLSLLFNSTAVAVGMVHVLLPYMLLPVHNAVSQLDPHLPLAARSLGAGRMRVLATIVLPLIARGIATGAILVFVLALGFYVTPQMLGGPRDVMLATYIDIMINTTLDWPRAAAAAVVLISGVALCFALLSLLSSRSSTKAVR